MLPILRHILISYVLISDTLKCQRCVFNNQWNIAYDISNCWGKDGIIHCINIFTNTKIFLFDEIKTHKGYLCYYKKNSYKLIRKCSVLKKNREEV